MNSKVEKGGFAAADTLRANWAPNKWRVLHSAMQKLPRIKTRNWWINSFARTGRKHSQFLDGSRKNFKPCSMRDTDVVFLTHHGASVSYHWPNWIHHLVFCMNLSTPQVVQLQESRNRHTFQWQRVLTTRHDADCWGKNKWLRYNEIYCP